MEELYQSRYTGPEIDRRLGLMAGNFLWIKWSATYPVVEMLDEPGPYIGIYTGEADDPPEDPAEYKWYLNKGDTGAAGADGDPGIHYGSPEDAPDSAMAVIDPNGSAFTTGNVPEGENLYYTPERADERVALHNTAPNAHSGQFANALTNKASGATVQLPDVQPYTKVQGLTLFGQTTETGAGDKSPDNPYALAGARPGKVTVQGKNLFDISEEFGSEWAQTANPGEYVNTQTAPWIYSNVRYMENMFLPNTQYTLTQTIKNPAGNNVRLQFIYTDGTASGSVISTGEYITSSFTSTAGKTVSCLRLVYSSYGEAGTVYIKNIQLELGAAATAYAPYIEPIDYPFPVLDAPLWSLPNGVRDSWDALTGAVQVSTKVITLPQGTSWTIPDAKDNSAIICSHSTLATLTGKTLTLPSASVGDVTLVYELETIPGPIYCDPIAPPILNAPVSTITADGAPLEIKYCRDINAAFAELQAAILALGGS